MRRVIVCSILVLTLAGCGRAAGADPAAAPAGATAPTPTTAAPAPAPPTASPSSPAAAPSPSATAVLSGTQHAYLKGADLAERTLTFDLVEWFEGKAAEAACAADGEAPAENDWCVGYYIRNKNTKLRTYPLAVGAALKAVGANGAEPVPADLATFRKALLGTGRLFRFTVVDGKITKAEEVYTP